MKNVTVMNYTFNSTRCIRNLKFMKNVTVINYTFNSTRCISNQDMFYCLLTYRRYLSTPHGALGTKTIAKGFINAFCFQLHTVHQERGGTSPKEVLNHLTFNSTRCIRNAVSALKSAIEALIFQLHTVHQEPQIATLTKIRHINNFVKRAPLSNEVNFPKSEIMQS